jgi:D-beta-D-heptose 7-phosphate kinase/D-beta-D-heptose 1-phosphate adenosyltransferase
MKTRARSKILDRRSLARLIARERSGGRSVVFTNGCFDLLHVGHVRSLEQAAAFGDLLVVGINRDRRVRQLKGDGRPLVPERQRAEVVAALDCVDFVTLFGETNAAPVIRALQPDVVCKGSEYRTGPIPERDMIESLGGRFVFLRQVPGVRSSLLVERSRS